MEGDGLELELELVEEDDFLASASLAFLRSFKNFSSEGVA